MDITITLTDRQVKDLKPIIDPYYEIYKGKDMPDKADIADLINDLINKAIDENGGWYKIRRDKA